MRSYRTRSRSDRLALFTGIPVAFMLVATTAVSAGSPEAQVVVERVSDLDGDGALDTLEVVLEGENRMEARSGTDGHVLWSSPCWMPAVGLRDHLGRPVLPILVDVDQDGRNDVVFVARGCRAVVAMDGESGSVAWQLPLDEIAGRLGSRVFSTSPPQYFERDLVLAEGRLFLAVRHRASLSTEEKEAGGALEARDPKNGTLLWRTALPLKSAERALGGGANLGDSHDGIRSGEADAAVLILSPATTTPMAPAGGTVPVGGNTSTSVSVSVEKPLVLNGIADTSRFLAEDGRIVYAGSREVRAVRSADGSLMWSWRPSFPKGLYNPALLRRSPDLLVFGWIDKGEFGLPTEAVVTLLDEATGKPRWQQVIPEVRPGTSGLIIQGGGQVKIELGKKVTLQYTSPNEKKSASKTVVLSRETGEFLSGAPGASGS